MRSKKLLIWSVLGAAVVFGLLQFSNPALTNPPVVAANELHATNAPPAAVSALLRRACYDCHSYETQWPWYARVAPASWFVVEHVKDGRRHLNFSEWPHDTMRKARSRWQNIRDEVQAGDMPLKGYAALHPAARLTDGEREQLATWADDAAARLSALIQQAEAGSETRASPE